MNYNQEKPGLKNFLTEETLLDLFGMKKEQLAYLRSVRQFPVIKMGGVRVYFEDDVVEWLLKNRPEIEEQS